MLYSSVQPDIIVGKTNNQVFSVVIEIRPNGYVEWEASRDVNGREFCAIAQTRDFLCAIIGRFTPGVLRDRKKSSRNNIPRNNIPEE